MANKVSSYIGNLGKSIGLSAIEVGKDYNKTFKSLMETNDELFKEIYYSGRNYKNTFKSVKNTIKSSKVYEAGDLYISNLKESIKTGEFYSKEREEKASLGAMGSNGDWDTDFDDFSSDLDSLDVNFDEEDEFSLEDGFEASSKANASVVSQVGEYIGEITKASSQALYAQNSQLLQCTSSGFATVTEGINSINNFMESVVKTHAENSLNYFSKSSEIQNETLNSIKELTELIKQGYGISNNKKELESDRRSNYDSLFDSQGMPDFKEYLKMVKKNAKSQSSTADLLFGDTFGEGSNLLLTFAANPLEGIMKGLIKGVVPSELKRVSENFNESLSGLFTSILANITNLKKSDNPILNKIGEVFGLKTSVKSSLDTEKYNKGAIPFDGITKKSIIEVIPGHLRRIESILAKSEERIYDFNSGSWKNRSIIKNEFDSKKQKSIDAATYDIKGYTNKFIEKMNPATYKDKKELDTVLNNVYTNLYDRNGAFNIKDMVENYYEYGFRTENEAKAFSTMWKNIPKHITMKFAGNVLGERSKLNKEMYSLEEKGNSPYLELFNNSYNEKEMKNKYKTVRSSKAIEQTSNEKARYEREEREYAEKINRNPNRYNYSPYDDDLAYQTDIVSSMVSRNLEQEEITKYADKENILGKKLKSVRGRIKEKDEELSKNPSRPKSLIDKLLVASTLSEKWNVINNSLADIASKPADFLVSTMNKVDQHLYDLIFGNDEEEIGVDGKPIKGFLGHMTNEVKKSFQKLNTFIDDNILNPLKKKLGIETLGDLFEKVASFFGFDKERRTDIKESIKSFLKIDEIKESIKNAFGGAYKETKNAVIDTYSPAIDAIRGSFNKYKATTKPLPSLPDNIEGGYTPSFNITDKFNEIFNSGIQNNANGSKYVNKSGLTAISKGEMIIPADLNPFNPDRKKADRNKQKENEKKVKGKFASEVYDTLFNSIDENADGVLSYDNSITDNIKDAKKLFIKKRINNKVNKTVSEIKNSKLYEKANKTAEEIANSKAAAYGEQVLNEIIAGAKKTSIALFGDPEKDKTSMSAAVKDVMKNVSNYAPDAIGYGLLGGATSLLTGAIGGPLLGAAAGAAIGITKKSKAVQAFLFGEESPDAEDGRKDNGVINKKIQKSFTKYFPSMKQYGLAGLATGFLTPFGPIGGLMIGSALGFAKKNQAIQEYIFGKEIDGEKQGGLISGKAQGAIKKALPKIGAGALLTMVAGPFGLLGNAALGSAGGFLSSTDKFQEFMFGKELQDGTHEQGLLDVIKETLVDPFKSMMDESKNKFLSFMDEKILNPLKDFIAPTTQMVRNMFTNIGESVTRNLSNFFEKTIGVPVQQFIKERVLNPLKKLTTGIFKAFLAPAKAVVSAPFRTLGWVGNNIRGRQIAKGTAYDMTASERLEWRKDHPVRGRSSRRLFRGNISNSLDEQLAGMTDVSQLQSITDNLGSLRDTTYFSDEIHSKKKSMTKSVIKYLRESGMESQLSLKQRDKILRAAQDGDMRKVKSLLNDRSLKIKGQRFKSRMDDKDQNALYDILNNPSKEIQSIKDRKENIYKEKDSFYAQMSSLGFKDINDKNISKYYNLFKTELGRAKSDKRKTIDNNTVSDEPKSFLEKSIETRGRNIETLLENINKSIHEMKTGEDTSSYYSPITGKRYYGGRHKGQRLKANLKSALTGDNNTIIHPTDYGVKTYVRTQDGKFDEEHSKENAEVNSKMEAEKGIFKSMTTKLSSIKDSFGEFFGLHKKEREEDKKKSLFSKIKDFFSPGKAIGLISAGVGGALKAIGLGAGTVATIASAGHISQWWKTKAYPNIKEWGKDFHLDEKLKSFGEGITSTGKRILNWLTNEGEFASDNTGIRGFMNKTVIPNLEKVVKWTSEGVGFFMENIIPPVVKSLFKALPKLITSAIKMSYNVLAPLFGKRKNPEYKDTDSKLDSSKLPDIYNSSEFVKRTWSNSNFSPESIDMDIDIDTGNNSISEVRDTIDDITDQKKETKKEQKEYIYDPLHSPLGRTAIKTAAMGEAPLLAKKIISGVGKTGKFLSNKIPIIGKPAGFMLDTGSKILNFGLDRIAEVKGGEKLINWFNNKLGKNVGKEVAEGAVEKIATSESFTKTIINKAVKFLEKFFDNTAIKKVFVGIIKKYKGVAKEAAEKLFKSTSDKFINALMKKITNSVAGKAAKSVSKFLGSKLGPVGIAFMVWDFGTGMKDAEMIMKVQDPNVIERALCGLLKAINGYLTGGLIPEDILVELLIFSFSSLGILDDDEIRRRQKELEDIIDAENAVNGTNYDTESYIKANRKNTPRISDGSSKVSALNSYHPSQSSSDLTSSFKAPTVNLHDGFGGKKTVRASEKINDIISQRNTSVSNMQFNNPNDTIKQTIGDSGCAPVAATNLINSLMPGHGSVKEAANFAIKNGFKERNGGTKIDYFKYYLASKGINSNIIPASEAIQNINNGNKTILLGQADSVNSPFGKSPHYIVARGMDNKGNVIVEDPNNTGVVTKYKPSAIGKYVSKAMNVSSAVGLGGGFGSYQEPTADLLNSLDIYGNMKRDLRVYGECTAHEINKWIKNIRPDSPFVGEGQAFVDASYYTGVDPRYLVAHAAVESAWGTSRIGREKHNYFGITAYDGSAYSSATTFKVNSIRKGIMEGAKWIARNFIRNDKYNQNTLWSMSVDPPTGHIYATGGIEWARAISNIMLRGPKHTDVRMHKPIGDLSHNSMDNSDYSFNSSSYIPKIDEYINPENITSKNKDKKFNLFSELGDLAKNVTRKLFGEELFDGIFGSENNSYSNGAVPVQMKNISGYKMNGTTAKDWFLETLENSNITSEYGINRGRIGNLAAGPHTGIDFSAAQGTEILSPIDGIITSVKKENESNGYGNLAILTDSKKGKHYFAHMSRIAVSEGTRIKRGDLIGYVGSTGNSTGPHLHYEVRDPERGLHCDPDTYLDNMSSSGYGNYKTHSNDYSNKRIELINRDSEYKNDSNKESIGGSDIVNYTDLLKAIINILVGISKNSDKLGQILDLLNNKLNLDIDTDDLKNNSKATQLKLNAAINNINTGGRSKGITGMSGIITDERLEYIFSAMDSLAKE